jgi:hypothetical protein
MSQHADDTERNDSMRLLPALILLFGTYSAAHAQANPPNAPLPSAIVTAQKIFLGNAGATDNGDCLRAYNGVYAGLSNDASIQMVLDPAKADLVLELNYELRPGAVSGPHAASDTAFARQFRLVILDPHTHTVLWSLTEAENNAVFQHNRNKNLDNAVVDLLADFKALRLSANPNAPTPPKPTHP